MVIATMLRSLEAQSMLLFVLQDKFRDRPPPSAAEPEGKPRDYGSALFAAALFLSAWSGLRLIATREVSFGFDVALAAGCLVLGLATMAHCLRSLGPTRENRR
jgi:hypothetical protein